MQESNGSLRFGTLAKAFHWATFLLLLASFGIGLTMVDLPLGPRKLQVYSWHKWVGVTVFLITVLRLGWRCINPAPPFPATMPGWQRIAAHASHGTLYGLLLVMPVSGWIMSSALGIPTVYFGVVPLPDLVAPDRDLGEALIHLHHALALALALTIAVHVAAAAYHHFVLGDDIARRMLPFMAVGKGDWP
jgi:cytochrome b561